MSTAFIGKPQSRVDGYAKVTGSAKYAAEFTAENLFDVIYYDAFDPKAQPELWTEEILKKIAAQTRTGGVLVTYSSKGIVKRALAAAGFKVEKHKGPGKKWHVLRAIKE